MTTTRRYCTNTQDILIMIGDVLPAPSRAGFLLCGEWMYFVYELIDPRTNMPFYVGKGSGGRIESHRREAQRGKPLPKNDRIREIWSAGYDFEHQIVRRFDYEEDAYDFEKKHIERIGLENLANVAPGGGAPSNSRGITAKQAALMFLKYAMLTKNFTQTVTFEMCGECVEINEECVASIKEMFRDFIKKHGIESFKRMLDGQTIVFQSRQI